MTNKAIVKKINDNGVTVSSVRKGACGDNCTMCGGCKGKEVLTEASCDIEVNIGDEVIIESNTLMVLFAMCVVFVFPIIVPLFVYIFLFDLNIVFSYVMAAVSILLMIILIAFVSRSFWFLNKIRPKVVSVIRKK